MKKLDLSYANKGLDPKVVAVHDGRFHVDDVFSAMLMRAIYPEVKLVRTRDTEELDNADIVIDVGYIYDANKLRFDHHQEGKAGKRDNGVEYSGLGLVWKEWGLDICKGNKELYEEIDISLVQPIDADDNGQSLYQDPVYNFDGIRDLTIGKLIAIHNNPSPKSLADFNSEFDEAMDFAEQVFIRILANKTSLVHEREKIIEDYKNQTEKRFIVDEEYRPVLRQAEYMTELLFYVFPRDTEGDVWLMKCAGGSERGPRRPLPKEWAGKNDVELEEASGIKDMLFCHNNLFICGATSKEAILEALEVALGD